jgi:hypothetical protein
MYIRSFIKIAPGIQNLIVQGDAHTHGQHHDLLGPLSFLQNEENRLEMNDGNISSSIDVTVET